MAFSVQMPALGESVTEGTVTRWLKQEGDQVSLDEPLLEVSTDKVDTEIPSPAAGILSKIVAGEDETVAVGAELGVISAAGETAPAAGAPAAAQPAAAQPAAQPAPPAEAPAPPAPPAPAPSSPAASGTPVRMPTLGESVTEGTVTRWLKQEGDQVGLDEPLLEVSTDKVDTEIPSPVAGTLLKILAAEDETVAVGADLALVGDAAALAAPASAPASEPEAAPEPEPEPAPTQQAPAPPTPAPQTPVVSAEPPSNTAQHSQAPYVTPLVRKLAAEHGVDLTTVSGTGVGGRIRKQDVMAAAAPPPAPEQAPAQPAQAPAQAPAAVGSGAPRVPTTIPARSADGPQPGTTVKLPRLRQVIAQRMIESLAASAQLTTVQKVDLTRIAALRARAKDEFQRREGVNLTFLPFYAKAVVEALRAFPQFNASINTEAKEIAYHGNVHLGIAVDTPRGLVVPVVRDADDLNLAGLAKRITDVAARTRNNQIGPNELSGGTFTITNLGSVGSLFDTPIINQPQVAILGTGAIFKEPAVIPGPDGTDVIAIRSQAFLPLTYDHRLIDGADAGRFLSAIRARLEEGSFESELGL